MEYVYRLNLPSLTDAVLPQFRDDPFESIKGKPNGVYRYVPKEFFNPEIASLKGLDWDRGSFFNKPPGAMKNVIHTDNHIDSVFLWSVNWIYGAGGGMNF